MTIDTKTTRKLLLKFPQPVLNVCLKNHVYHYFDPLEKILIFKYLDNLEVNYFFGNKSLIIG